MHNYIVCASIWYRYRGSSTINLGGVSRTSFIMVVYGEVIYDVISGDVFGRIEIRYHRCTTTWYVLPFGIGTVALALLTWEELAGQAS